MTWEKAAAVERVQQKPIVYKRAPLQIALFWVDGRPYAVDNRCPHEGYPLAEGTTSGDCLLTCNWHNWKFRLGDGECVLGGDHVRAYPVKVEDDFVWVDTAPPPPEEIERKTLGGLKTAFLERDFGRICREISRLHYHKLDPLAAVVQAAQWSHDNFEFGYTHAYAASADWLALANRFGGDWEPRLICLAEAVDHMAFDSLRHKTYAYAPPAAAFSAEAFCEAVESEDRETAESLAGAAARDGIPWPNVEAAFAEAALAHYNDFGHSLIYVYKTRQWMEALEKRVGRYLLPALARHLSYTTREDLLPEFNRYAPALAELRPFGASDQIPPAPLEMGVTGACEWLIENSPNFSARAIYDALLQALAKNLLCYDTSFQDAFDRPVNQNVGWLSITHGVTFANAVRNICALHPHLWPAGLMQMACFVGRNSRFANPQNDGARWHVDDAASFFTDIQQLLLDHGQRDPIFSAHLLKTSVAVEEEAPHASPACRGLLLASLNRFLHSPIKRKHVRRLARQAIDLVQRDFE